MPKRISYNGSIKIIELPFGENRSDKKVADNPKDRKNSVYSKKYVRKKNRNSRNTEVKIKDKDGLNKTTPRKIQNIPVIYYVIVNLT